MAYRLGFVMEQTLGHVTHAKNLFQCMEKDPDIIPTWIPVSFDAPDRWDKVPVIRSNWTLRSSLKARDQLQAALQAMPLDGLFFHTSVTAVFSRPLMARIPTVVSMDATPLNFDDIGLPYDHGRSFALLESLKNTINRRMFRAASRLVVWCDWAKASLVNDYKVVPDKVEVIAPGVDLQRWKPGHDAGSQQPVRLLFVGGDFRRKGGYTVLEAFRTSLQHHCELDIVTREDVDIGGLPGVRVHRLGPNSPELMALYARADIFTFPTQADVLPLAIMEAMASGLPVITTEVGALREQIEDGINGFVVPPGDAAALARATLKLVENPSMRQAMSVAARQCASRKFDAETNYRRVLDVCKACVDASRGTPHVK
jgi:glycosyltransferase involved in cell wall biosynthesis